MYSVFLSNYTNTRESLGELEKAVETLACCSCPRFLVCPNFYSCFYLTNRFHVAVHLSSNRSQMTSKCGKNEKVTQVTTFWCPVWSITGQMHGNMEYISPVPELSFLPAPYRGWTRAGERRVQDNLHAHAQNDAIFFPQIRGKTIFGSTFQIWLVARFSEWQHTSNNFCIRLIKNMSINPKSVEFHQCHANSHYHQYRSFSRDVITF